MTIVNGTLQVPPVQFTITAVYGGKTVEVERFSQYVQRVIEIPAGTDASRITTAVVKEPDGTERQVPTCVFMKDGKWYAKINSLTNSTYALIYNQASFADAAGKWYESIVGDNGQLRPNDPITRAESATVVLRLLRKAGLVDVRSAA